jgi:pimeloyl-ACP methyl ester carboxylesterase
MTAWVFLRGLSREARHWGDFPETFAAVLGESPSEILTPDLPGNGRHCREASPLTVESMMEACRRDLREQGRAPPYHLLALSLGGMVALAWARRHPEECRAVVLLSSSLRPHNPFHQRLRPGAWPALLKLLLAEPARRESAILELTSADPDAHRQVLPEWLAYAREHPVTRRNTLRQLLAAARFSMPDKPPVPLLILAGANDRMVNPRCSETLARVWSADFARHPTAGHDLPLDAGAWVARVVAAWKTQFPVS